MDLPQEQVGVPHRCKVPMRAATYGNARIPSTQFVGMAKLLFDSVPSQEWQEMVKRISELSAL